MWGQVTLTIITLRLNKEFSVPKLQKAALVTAKSLELFKQATVGDTVIS